MICCILALLAVGPLGALLVPRKGEVTQPDCCRLPVSPLLIWLAAAALVAISMAVMLALLDPPTFRHLCLYRVTR